MQDITCYKVMLELPKTKGHKFLLSLYMNMKYALGKIYETEIVTMDTHIFKSEPFLIINNGFHSFRELADAALEAMSWYKHSGIIMFLFKKPMDLVVVECVIPEGAEYYQGDHGNKRGYASNKIKALKVLSRYGTINELTDNG